MSSQLCLLNQPQSDLWIRPAQSGHLPPCFHQSPPPKRSQKMNEIEGYAGGYRNFFFTEQFTNNFKVFFQKPQYHQFISVMTQYLGSSHYTLLLKMLIWQWYHGNFESLLSSLGAFYILSCLW